MNYLHIATLLLIVARILNYIDWSWWVVLAPSIVSFTVGFIVLVIALVLAWKGMK